MAAVLGREPGDEGRLPERLEAVRLAGRRDAGEQRVGEDDAAVAVEGEVVDVEVAGVMGELRHDRPHRSRRVGAPSRGIDEGGNLVHRCDGEAAAGDGHPHRPVERALEDRQAVGVRVAADEEDLAALVGGEGEAAAGLGEPARRTGAKRSARSARRPACPACPVEAWSVEAWPACCRAFAQPCVASRLIERRIMCVNLSEQREMRQMDVDAGIDRDRGDRRAVAHQIVEIEGAVRSERRRLSFAPRRVQIWFCATSDRLGRRAGSDGRVQRNEIEI